VGRCCSKFRGLVFTGPPRSRAEQSGFGMSRVVRTVRVSNQRAKARKVDPESHRQGRKRAQVGMSTGRRSSLQRHLRASAGHVLPSAIVTPILIVCTRNGSCCSASFCCRSVYTTAHPCQHFLWSTYQQPTSPALSWKLVMALMHTILLTQDLISGDCMQEIGM
jgi:hypothetical protein